MLCKSPANPANSTPPKPVHRRPTANVAESAGRRVCACRLASQNLSPQQLSALFKLTPCNKKQSGCQGLGVGGSSVLSGWLQNAPWSSCEWTGRGHRPLCVVLRWDLSGVPLSGQTDEQRRRARTQTSAGRNGDCPRGDSSRQLEHCVSCEEHFSLSLFKWVFLPSEMLPYLDTQGETMRSRQEEEERVILRAWQNMVST